MPISFLHCLTACRLAPGSSLKFRIKKEKTMQNQGIKKIVLAYSGGLDTSAIIPWLKENYGGCEVVAFVADIGQERSDLEGVEQKALQSGASECHVVDLREEFISDYVYPVLQTGALYEGSYLLGTSMARPIIAKAQVELALKVGADALCHGATGKGNDQVRFETTYTALAPHLKVVAPWREWNLRSREALLDYLKERNIPTTASLEKIYSRDENAWHISTEGGVLESPWNAPNKDCWVWTVDPAGSSGSARAGDCHRRERSGSGGKRRSVEPVQMPGDPERVGRQTWCGPYRYRGKPFGGYQIPRLLRNPGWHHHGGGTAWR
jgi:hypothetical protein